MRDLPLHLQGLDGDAETFIRDLLARAAAVRLPELAGEANAELLYRMPERGGVTTVAVRTSSLQESQLRAIMTYRLAQYVLADQLDPRLLFERRLLHEPLDAASPLDVHFPALASDGEILSYATVEAVVADHPMGTFANQDRPLFAVEEVFGLGVFQRLNLMRDLPVARARELGRFTKNHFRSPMEEAMVRAPVEVGVAVFTLMRGTLRAEMDVVVGDVEEGVAKKNLDFFHLPIVLLHGVVPYAPEGSFGHFNYQHRARYPFAFSCSDISAERLRAIDAALSQPGHAGVMALLELRKDVLARASSLEPTGGVPPLDDLAVPQRDVPMARRRQLLDAGEWLRSTSLFAGLSVAEAAVLGGLMERGVIAAGTTIVRQGDLSGDLYVIESGTADVVVSTLEGERVVLKRLGARDYFGEIALVTGGERTADVIASSELTILRLSQEAFARYLARMAEVQGDLTRTALLRTHDTLRKVRGPQP